MRLAPPVIALSLALACVTVSAAGEPAPEPDRPRDPRTLAPRPLQAEVGQLLGVIFPSPRHNFHDEQRSHSKLNGAAMLVGARAAFLPIPWLGLELDAVLAPSATADGRGATIGAARGHLLGQWPQGRWATFLLLGAGRMGLRSEVVGSDADPALELGAGLKYAVSSVVLARCDLRDTLTQRNGADAGSLAHHVELTIGFSYRLPKAGAARQQIAERAPVAEDACRGADRASNAGCPDHAPDSEALHAPRGRCPAAPGSAQGGCPHDRDGDGVSDAADSCPDMAASGRDGCVPDLDADGILDEDDRCPIEPETQHGPGDADGCPDGPRGGLELEFEPGREALRAMSRGVLDELVQELEATAARARITAEVGELNDRAANLALAERRLAVVVQYLVSKGIQRARLDTVGTAREPGAGATTPAGSRIQIEVLPELPR